MVARLFLRKSIEALQKEGADKTGFRRALGPLQLTAMGIGAIIGAGIFVLTGQAAASYAGPAVVISFIIASILCFFTALCYAEFASTIPVSGSAYTYAYASLGEIVAWTIGWALILEYLFSVCAVAVGWSGYLSSLLRDFGIVLPKMLSSAPFNHSPTQGWYLTGDMLNLPAMFIVAVIGILITVGIQAAARLNEAMVVIKVAIVLLFIAFGIPFVKTGNWTPFIPENTGQFGHFGWSGIFRGASVVFFAYIGFDAVSTLAQEARHPKKDMPLGMLGSLSVSTILYILVALVLTGLVSHTDLNVPDPIAKAIDNLGPSFAWFGLIIKFAILAGLTSVILVMLVGQTRIFYTMAHDGLMPMIFAKLHHKFRTPYVTTIITTLLGLIIAGLFPVGILAELVSMGALLAFGIVNIGILVLHYRRPDLVRPFKTPFVPFVPLIGGLGCLFQMIVLPLNTWIQLIVWLLIGCIIYFSYGKKNSLIQKAHQQSHQ